jgi:UDP-N-acetylglucosamine 2-epimerase (non-hydrolysing)
VADVIYTYFDEYKAQAVGEGINPRNVVVVQNLIVDVLQHYYFDRLDYFEELTSGSFFEARGLERGEYFVMTCHRRESVEDPAVLANILDFLSHVPRRVYFTASYRTQKNLTAFGMSLPENVTMVDPIGYDELLALIVNSRGALTDSGTIVEETAILQVPSLQIRRATERPQVYDCGSSVKYDPSRPDAYPIDVLLAKLDYLYGRTWEHGLGDGKASDRVSEDLLRRLRDGDFRGHEVEHHNLVEAVRRSHREDGLPVG